ncbi:hypothetical protein E2C01_057460 [Portunus trituberculatus]|uniref:Uncharacterized protein n=1 Tax=Portunus trituberculatus TaxID=210409 RepID=A0A5B7GWV1_PORTR|nr:hypothetical protein [Portunus trituberculatus]
MFRCRTLLDSVIEKDSKPSKQPVMCAAEMENLFHFLLHCPTYGEERRKNASTTLLTSYFGSQPN